MNNEQKADLLPSASLTQSGMLGEERYLNKKPIPKGCKIYQFGSFECVAINYKTAQRKFNKYMLKKMKL